MVLALDRGETAFRDVVEQARPLQDVFLLRSEDFV